MKKVAISLICATPLFAIAQTADEIIDKYTLARGGKEKLAAVQSVYMEGSREMMGNEVTVRVMKVQGKLSRTEFDMAGATGFFLVTDQEAWNFIPMRAQTANQLPAEAVKNMQGELDIVGPLFDYAAKGHKVELVKKDTLDGKLCYKIKLTPANGRDINYWIDATSYLLVQSSTKGGGGMMGGGRRTNTGGGGAPAGNATEGEKREIPETITVYNDYKAVDGVLIPHNIEIKSANGQGRGGGGTTFDKIELNKSIDAKYFKPE